VWMDLEMTGLIPEKDVIVEIATIITDDQLNVIAEGPDIVITILMKFSPSWTSSSLTCIPNQGY